MSERPIHVFLAGDSTVANYGCLKQPMQGWGQVLPTYFDSQQVCVCNYAICGRSSRTFVEEGRLARIAREIQAGDYLFIQFGHNDATVAKPQRYVEPTHDFGRYLRQYIAEARAHGATPVLVTPMQRRNFDDAGKLVYDHGPYIAAMQQVAQAEQVTLLDLSSISGQYFDQAGAEGTKQWFFHFPAGELPNYPDGAADNTHFQPAGAALMCELLVGELEKTDLPLKNYLQRFHRHTLWLVGDSTLANYGSDEEPMCGWGQQLGQHFDARHLVVSNQAACGRSAQSFSEQGRLAWLAARLRPDDWLLIEFAHNDEKLGYTKPVEQFQGYLRQYIETARRCGAHPLLVTPVERRHFVAGQLVPTHIPYVRAMQDLGAQLDVPVIDLTAATQALYTELGDKPSQKLFMHVAPGEFPNYPDGRQDDTHFNAQGAARVAQLFTQLLRASGLPLADYLTERQVGL
ncbi:MAG: rhamnogalacturonan acetylesterase [Selenomonadaceae bacterium]|nr:rhamnogalacturonan acetylesterase [Selenomonadaceae bacterium]